MSYNTKEKQKEYNKKAWNKIRSDSVLYAKVREQQKIYALNNKEKTALCNKKNALKRCYNLSWEEYNQLKEDQNHLCAICKLQPIEVVDHCHRLNKVRGLPCQNCNRALGHLKDNSTSCRNAAEYLEAFEDTQSKSSIVEN